MSGLAACAPRQHGRSNPRHKRTERSGRGSVPARPPGGRHCRPQYPCCAAVRRRGQGRRTRVPDDSGRLDLRRRAWLPLRLLLALAALALDGMACYFAVQALGGSQSDILLWTCLFLGALSAGQIILDFCRKRAWRALATLSTRGKCLVPAFSSRPVTAASSASRPASPRAPPTATAVIVIALAVIWTPPLRWPQMRLQEG